MKRLLVLIIFLFMLSGCVSEAKALATPSNVRFEENVLHWDAVEGARYYIVNINEETFYTNESFYDLRYFLNEDYTIKLSAHVNNRPASEEVVLIFEGWLAHPHYITYEGGVHYFEAVDNALTYDLYVNNAFVVSLLDPWFSDTLLDANRVLHFYVIARNETRRSVASTQVMYANFDDPLFMTLLTQTIVSPAEVILPYEGNIEHVMHNEGTLLEGYVIENTTFTLTQAFVSNLGLGQHTFYVQTDAYHYSIVLEIIDEREPVLIGSPSRIHVYNTSLTFDFHLYNNQITQLSGYNLTQDDYAIGTEHIYLTASYLDTYFTQTNEQLLVLAYVIETKDETLINYLYIYKPII